MVVGRRYGTYLYEAILVPMAKDQQTFHSIHICVQDLRNILRWPGRSRVRATVGERKWVRAVVAEQK